MSVSDTEEAELDVQTMAGGWRLLCLSTLADAITVLHEEGYSSGFVGEWTPTAERWLKGGVGAVTFEECCEAAGVNPAVARNKIDDYLVAHRRRPHRGRAS